MTAAVMPSSVGYVAVMVFSVLLLLHTSDAQRRRNKCVYERRSDDLTECINSRQIMTVKLQRGNEDTCEPLRTRERKCKTEAERVRARGNVCKYSKATIGDCDPLTRKQLITRDLLPDQSGANCLEQKTKARSCRQPVALRRQIIAEKRSERKEQQERRVAARKEQKEESKKAAKQNRKAVKDRNKAKERSKLMKLQANKLDGFYTCQYVRGVTSPCVNNITTRIDTLIPTSSEDCTFSRTVEIPCETDTQTPQEGDDDNNILEQQQ